MAVWLPDVGHLVLLNTNPEQMKFQLLRPGTPQIFPERMKIVIALNLLHSAILAPFLTLFHCDF